MLRVEGEWILAAVLVVMEGVRWDEMGLLQGYCRRKPAGMGQIGVLCEIPYGSYIQQK